MVKKAFAPLLILLLASIVHAQVAAEGGNVTRVDVAVISPSAKWQGFVGVLNVASSNGTIATSSGNVTPFNINITASCASPTVTGFLLFSNSTVLPLNVVAGNKSLLDSFLGVTTENSTNTFPYVSSYALSSGVVANVSTAFTFVNENPQSTSYKEGYLNDNESNFVFAVEIDSGATGYNGSVIDYQVILPNAISSWFVTTDLSISCASVSPVSPRPVFRQKSPVYQPPDLFEPVIQPEIPFPVPELPPEEIERIRDLQPMELTVPDEIFAVIAQPLVVDVIVSNPNEVAGELLRVQLKMPSIVQKFESLHEDPPFPALYSLFGMYPVSPTVKVQEFADLKPQSFRVEPKSDNTVSVVVDVPIVSPQSVQGLLTLDWGNVPITSKPITVHFVAPEFAVRNQHVGRSVDVGFMVNNVGKPSRKSSVEVDFNKGKQTMFSEVYDVTLPENSVAVYGYSYKALFDYDTLISKNDGVKSVYKARGVD